jgi:transposase
MLKGGTILRLHEMKADGKSIRQIAKETGHSRNTVRKYVRDGHIPEAKERAKRGSKLDPYKEIIDRWIKEDGLFNCQAMLMRLQEQGYTGGATIIKDYVQSKRPPRRPKVTMRYETRPGEQAQVDWGYCETVMRMAAVISCRYLLWCWAIPVPSTWSLPAAATFPASCAALSTPSNTSAEFPKLC